jgi:hypothetical protein
MKKLKLFLGVIAITIFALQPISSALAFEDDGCPLQQLEPKVYLNAKKKWFSNNCKLKCDHICNIEKRDVTFPITIE